MPTKEELETENASLTRKVGRLETKLAAQPVPKTVTVVKEVIKEVAAPAAIQQPPSVSGVMYTESHPILGVTRRTTKTADAIGDGRIGDGATIVREVNG